MAKNTNMITVSTALNKKDYADWIKFCAVLFNLKKIPEETDYAALKYVILESIKGFKSEIKKINNEAVGKEAIPAHPTHAT